MIYHNQIYFALTWYSGVGIPDGAAFFFAAGPLRACNVLNVNLQSPRGKCLEFHYWWQDPLVVSIPLKRKRRIIKLLHIIEQETHLNFTDRKSHPFLLCSHQTSFKMQIWTSHSPTQNPSSALLVDEVFHSSAHHKVFDGLCPAYVSCFFSWMSCSPSTSDTHSDTCVSYVLFLFLKTLFFHLPVWPAPICPFSLSSNITSLVS